MPGARGLLAKFTGGTIGGAASYAAGGATSRVLTPGLQSLENEAWKRNAVVPPDAYVLAEGVAQGQVDPKAAHAWAAEQGIGTAQFAALVSIANSGPGLSAALELWRRNLIGEAAFRRALKRMGLEPEWIDGLVQIKGRLLDVADLARASDVPRHPHPRRLPARRRRGEHAERVGSRDLRAVEADPDGPRFHRERPTRLPDIR
jgi:hypothetical protein